MPDLNVGAPLLLPAFAKAKKSTSPTLIPLPGPLPTNPIVRGAAAVIEPLPIIILFARILPVTLAEANVTVEFVRTSWPIAMTGTSVSPPVVLDMNTPVPLAILAT